MTSLFEKFLSPSELVEHASREKAPLRYETIRAFCLQKLKSAVERDEVFPISIRMGDHFEPHISRFLEDAFAAGWNASVKFEQSLLGKYKVTFEPACKLRAEKVIYEPMGVLEGDWEDLVPKAPGLPELTVYTTECWRADGYVIPVSGSVERDGVLHIIIDTPSITPELVAQSLAKHFRVPISDVVFVD